MSRAERLLELLQVLRQHKRPAAGTLLAAALGISLRTLYRDIAALRAQGAMVEGEPGLGYVLRPGYMLPPLMLTDAEIEAVVLGSRWVTECADEELALAARGALAKIAAVLPKDHQAIAGAANLLIGPGREQAIIIDPAVVRKAIRDERKAKIQYADERGHPTSRVIWPFALAYFHGVQVVVAWCELRQAYRHFRVDRIGGWCTLDAASPRRRQFLLNEWRSLEGVPEQ